MSNNTVTPQNSPNTLIITDKDQNQVIVTQPVTSIIEITAPGTQGPNISPETSILIISESNPSTSTVIQPDVKTITISATGVQGPAGPAPDTSSLVSITSFNAFTSSYTTGSFTGSFIGDGSQLTGIVSSKWTGSNPISRESDVEVTGSFSVTGDITATSFTGSLFGTASYVPNLNEVTTAGNTTTNAITVGTITSDFTGGTNTFSILTAANSSGQIHFQNSGYAIPRWTIRATGAANGSSGELTFQRLASSFDLSIKPTGNVLIGTTTDGARLRVKGSGTTSATTALLVENANASASLFVRDDGNVGIGTSVLSNDVRLTIKGELITSNKIILNLQDGLGNSKFSVKSDGGLTSTGFDSSIYSLFSTGDKQPILFSHSGYGANTPDNTTISIGYRGRQTGGNNSYDYFNYKIFQGSSPNVISGFEFYTHQNQTSSLASQLALSIKGADLLAYGNVGIGTTTPSASLDVSGSGRFTDGLTVTGSGIFTDIYSPILNGEGDIRRIINPQGAQLSNSTATSTGVIKFKIPSVVGNNYSNYGFVVQIGSQGGFLSETFIQARWMVSGFDRLEAYTLGRNFKVRVGTDGTDQYLLIGETDSTWYRTNITLREFYVDYVYKDIDTFKEGWEVSFDTDISDISINETVTNSDYAQQFFGYLQLTDQTFTTGSWNTIATLDTLSGTGTFLIKRIDQGLLNFTVADSYGRRILKLNYLTQLSPNLYQGIRITTDNKVQVLIGTIYNSINDIYVFNSKGVTLTNATASGAETVDKVITFNSTEEGEITTDPLTVRNNFTVTGSTVLKGSGTTSATTALLVENANASASLFVRDDGNVGIGITSPSSRLHIYEAGTTAGFLLEASGSSTSRDVFKVNAIGPNSDNTRLFQVQTNGTSVFEFRGNGLGTIGIDYADRISGSPRLSIGDSSGNRSLVLGVKTGMSYNSNNPRKITAFFTKLNEEVASFDDHGRVIFQKGNTSTSAPSDGNTYRLTVSGSARITDNLTVTGSLVTQGQTIDPALIWFMS